MAEYNHTKIEDTWKPKWFEDNIYAAVDFSDKPKKYILAELPYPSGDYLHVGHMMRYTVPEIYSRYLRMKGYNVLYPMGWDSFGLPTETNAIKTNRTPQKVIQVAKHNYKNAMQDMGYAIDWDREIDTSEPEFYKWTQWTFLKMWEKGLVKQKELPVWWCEQLGVLADEEVLPDEGGPTGKKSERDGHPVVRKNLTQWVLKITDYADKLLDGLDEVDYTDAIKTGQRNWIGRNEGINITYDIVDSNETVTCFTTTPVNWGASFIVLAPEHAAIANITSEKQKDEVSEYVERVLKKSDLERQEDKEKSGVFTGAYALNHVTGEKLPVWVADFVLSNVGTGAVQGCPGHDARDFEFAKKYELPIPRVVVGEDGYEGPIETEEQVVGRGTKGKMVNSDFLNGMDFAEAMQKTMDYFEEKGWGKRAVTYKLRDQIWSRQRYWGDPIPLKYKDDGTVEGEYTLPVELPILENFQPENGLAPLEKVPEWYTTTAKNGSPAKRETDTMPTWAGSNWYYIRYLDPHNSEEYCSQDKLNYWLPVDKYFGDAGHTNAHLLYTRFWTRFLYDIGEFPHKEPIKWRMSGGLLLGADNRKMSKSRQEFVVNPKHVIESYGADAARVYLAFIGPYDETYPWNENGIKACYRFIKNVYNLQDKVSKKEDFQPIKVAYNKMVKRITQMAEDLKMNTAVSEMMIFVNECKKVEYINRDTYLGFLKVLAPFAPFVTEDVWQKLNGFDSWKSKNSIHLAEWPKFDDELTIDSMITVPVQINGKLRTEVEVSRDISEEEIKKLALDLDTVKKYLEGNEPKKVIYIPRKIINIVSPVQN